MLCRKLNRVIDFCLSIPVKGEEAFDTASIQTEIDSLNHQKISFLDRLFGGGKTESDEFKRLKERFQFAQHRQSEPRCLRCGEPTWFL
jgi:hypothetical protein